MPFKSQGLLKNSIFSKILHAGGSSRAEYISGLILTFLKKEEKILDIGAGSCNVCELLNRKGYKVTPIDVQNISLVKSITPRIYDGMTLPFKKDSFDISLIISVLHHTKDPEGIIKEATRVSRKLIIHEDVFDNSFEKFITFLLDSLLNEFGNNPHNNKTNDEWNQLFGKMNLRVVSYRYSRWIWCPFFKHVTYYLERK